MFRKREKAMMLDTSEERVRLLKNGMKNKTIEELYIRHNKIEIIRSPILFDFVENSSSNRMDSPESRTIELKHACKEIEREASSMNVLVIAFLPSISS